MAGIRYVLTVSILALVAGTAVADEPPTGEVAKARGIVQSFGKTLKGRLVAAISESGPVHAVDVCKIEAPRIAEAQEKASGWSVGRTALKVRNPDNAPDQWERRVLESFVERAAAGEDMAMMERVETVDRDGRKALRYMKAIPTGEVCVTCHGAELQPDLAARIDELYPNDQARGFEPGDLRGAFTLVKPLDR